MFRLFRLRSVFSDSSQLSSIDRLLKSSFFQRIHFHQPTARGVFYSKRLKEVFDYCKCQADPSVETDHKADLGPVAAALFPDVILRLANVKPAERSDLIQLLALLGDKSIVEKVLTSTATLLQSEETLRIRLEECNVLAENRSRLTKFEVKLLREGTDVDWEKLKFQHDYFSVVRLWQVEDSVAFACF